MWPDHGLCEFVRQQRSGHGPWAGTHLSAPAHWYRDRYGAFPGPVTFAEVGALLDARGVPLVEVPYPADQDEMRTYWQPEARILVHVVAGSSYGQPGELDRVASSNTGIP